MITLITGVPGSGFNTQPPEGGWFLKYQLDLVISLFQHTAARRRLGHRRDSARTRDRFNTQPPEGGWGESYLLIHLYT